MTHSVKRGLTGDTLSGTILYADQERYSPGLRRFIERDDPSGLPGAAVEKIRNILSFLQDMETPAELRAIGHWKAHRLTGDRKGTWSLIVSRNWRLTFRIDTAEGEMIDLDYEDYH